MGFLKSATIENLIVNALQTGALMTAELLEKVRADRAVTKQGFYAALRKLEREETVVIYKKTVALNVAWVKELLATAIQVQKSYLPGEAGSEVLALAERESISYVFSSTKHLDAFWGHSQSILVSQTPVSEPVYTYDPHYWFYLARPETEKRIVRDIAESGRQFLMTTGGKTFLDAVISKDFAGDTLQYHMEKLFDARNRYIVVIGDYVTEGLLDQKIVDQVDAIYERSSAADLATIHKLEDLLTIRARHKLRITRSARKARELKAKMGKNFFVRST